MLRYTVKSKFHENFFVAALKQITIKGNMTQSKECSLCKDYALTFDMICSTCHFIHSNNNTTSCPPFSPVKI